MKARGLPVTAIVRLTFQSLVDHFVQRYTLAVALIESKQPWTLPIRKKFEAYTAKAQMHIDCMLYNTENGVFEIRTFPHAGNLGNVHVITSREKKCTCGKWRNYHMPCSHAIKCCNFSGIEPRDYVSEYYSCKLYKQTYYGKFFSLGEEANWPPSPFSLLPNTKYERTSGVQHIAGHNRTRCPKNP